MIDVDRLRTLLKFDGVEVNYSDEELSVIIDAKLDELEGYIGCGIRPKDKSLIIGHFKGKFVELDYYPVLQVARVFINDEFVSKHDYNVNYDLGLLYFEDYQTGSLKVEYTSGLSDRDYYFLISPLIKDMIGYTISYGKINQGVGGWGYLASSLREGDVSINFSNGSTGSGTGNYGYNASINSKIDSLKDKYARSARVKLL